MYLFHLTKRFVKDLKKCEKRGLQVAKVVAAIDILSKTGTLPPAFRPHKLVGDYAGAWECHIGGPNSDWIMVWEQNDTELTLLMLRTGTHSDIF